MKSKIIGIFCLVCLIGMWLCITARPTEARSPQHQWVALQDQPYQLQPGANGRYQIITAAIDNPFLPPHDDGPTAGKTAVRIDTQTGRTWEMGYISDESTGNPKLSWIPVSESNLVEK